MTNKTNFVMHTKETVYLDNGTLICARSYPGHQVTISNSRLKWTWAISSLRPLDVSIRGLGFYGWYSPENINFVEKLRLFWKL